MSVNNHNHETENAKVLVQEEGRKEKPQSLRKQIRVRLIPIWLRVIIVLLLIGLSTVSGAAVGYGIFGNGKVSEIFQKSTWTHIKELVEKE